MYNVLKIENCKVKTGYLVSVLKSLRYYQEKYDSLVFMFYVPTPFPIFAPAS